MAEDREEREERDLLRLALQSQPKRMKFKNNEIMSSYSSCSFVGVNAAIGQSKDPLDMERASSKRKLSPGDPGEEVYQEAKVLKLGSPRKGDLSQDSICLVLGIPDEDEDQEEDAFDQDEEEEEQRVDSFSSDKENEKNEDHSEAEVAADRLEKKKEEKEIGYQLPEYFHTLKEHRKDEDRTEARLNKLLNAIREVTRKSPSVSSVSEEPPAATSALTSTTASLPQISSAHFSSLQSQPGISSSAVCPSPESQTQPQPASPETPVKEVSMRLNDSQEVPISSPLSASPSFQMKSPDIVSQPNQQPLLPTLSAASTTSANQAPTSAPASAISLGLSSSAPSLSPFPSFNQQQQQPSHSFLTNTPQPQQQLQQHFSTTSLLQPNLSLPKPNPIVGQLLSPQMASNNLLTGGLPVGSTPGAANFFSMGINAANQRKPLTRRSRNYRK